MIFSLLWTDWLFLFVLVACTVTLSSQLGSPSSRRVWGKILGRPVAASAAVVLFFFLAIATLDSVRIQHADERVAASMLDRLLAPLDTQYEKTYSVPFALVSYLSETQNVAQQVQQVYPRLTYPPAHWQTEHDVWRFTWRVVVQAFLVMLLVVGLLWGGVSGARRRIAWPRATGWSVLLTLLVCGTVALACYWLSREIHVLGTGKIGQDIFYYSVKSIRTGLVIGLLTTLFMLPLALFAGISAGYFGGVVDDIIQYVYTTLSSVPGVLLITASVLSIQTYITNHPEQFTNLEQVADARLLALCFILGLTSWTGLCRVLRAETLMLREVDFVVAAVALGSRSLKIIITHLLPNVMHIVMITLVLDFSFLVLAEAVLSYVGVGVSPLTMSWGNMINAARLELSREPVVWWPMVAAFIFMFTLVLASNLFADAVQDALDPRRT